MRGEQGLALHESVWTPRTSCMTVWPVLADMLEVGPPGNALLSLDQQQAHFALWALVKSPLTIGADLKCALGRGNACSPVGGSCAWPVHVWKVSGDPAGGGACLHAEQLSWAKFNTTISGGGVQRQRA